MPQTLRLRSLLHESRRIEVYTSPSIHSSLGLSAPDICPHWPVKRIEREIHRLASRSNSTNKSHVPNLTKPIWKLVVVVQWTLRGWLLLRLKQQRWKTSHERDDFALFADKTLLLSRRKAWRRQNNLPAQTAKKKMFDHSISRTVCFVNWPVDWPSSILLPEDALPRVCCWSNKVKRRKLFDKWSWASGRSRIKGGWVKLRIGSFWYTKCEQAKRN